RPAGKYEAAQDTGDHQADVGGSQFLQQQPLLFYSFLVLSLVDIDLCRNRCRFGDLRNVGPEILSLLRKLREPIDRGYRTIALSLGRGETWSVHCDLKVSKGKNRRLMRSMLGGPFTLKYAIDIGCRLPVGIEHFSSKGHQTAARGEVAGTDRPPGAAPPMSDMNS